jgi:hypothetical protein
VDRAIERDGSGPQDAGMTPGTDSNAHTPTRPDLLPRPRWWDGVSWRSAITVSLFGLVADLWGRSPLGLGLAACVVVGVLIFIVMVQPGGASMVFLASGVVIAGFVAVRSNQDARGVGLPDDRPWSG